MTESKVRVRVGISASPYGAARALYSSGSYLSVDLGCFLLCPECLYALA